MEEKDYIELVEIDEALNLSTTDGIDSDDYVHDFEHYYHVFSRYVDRRQLEMLKITFGYYKSYECGCDDLAYRFDLSPDYAKKIFNRAIERIKRIPGSELQEEYTESQLSVRLAIANKITQLLIDEERNGITNKRKKRRNEIYKDCKNTPYKLEFCGERVNSVLLYIPYEMIESKQDKLNSFLFMTLKI